MVSAAKALIKIQEPDIADDPDTIVTEFRTRFHDTRLFHDPFAGAKFAHYLFRTHDSPPDGVSEEQARQHIEEAQLFIEAAHACYDRVQQGGQAATA
jgi:sulfite reductase (ferredoxin)